MADLDGKTILLTGATNGIGLEACVKLARRGAEVVMVGRDPARSEKALADVKRRSGSGKVSLLLCDFASLAAVRSLADAYRARHPRLDVLVNNAGSVNDKRVLTTDGYEQTFAVNHLAPFLLTSLLLDLLKASAPARVVTVASRAHYRGMLDFEDLHYERGGYFILKAYGRSKLANVLFANELARRLEGTGVTSTSLHPGAVATNIWSHAPAWTRPFLRVYARLKMITAEEGADTIVQLAADPALEGHTGEYWSNLKLQQPSATARDETVAKRLWEVSERLTGLAERAPDEAATR